MENVDNRKRALNEIVSVEAWHLQFKKGIRTVKLHVDVTFKEGRLGGEADSPVTFRLALEKAEVIVVVPETEPCDVILRSVARDGVASAYSEIGTIQKKAATQIAASANPTAKRKVQHASGKRVSRKGVLELQTVHSKTEEGFHSWSISSSTDGVISGKPWDPIKSPRMQIKDRRNSVDVGIPPQVRIQIRCLKEDLIISEIKSKKLNPMYLYNPNKIAAAEAFIREKLKTIDFDIPVNLAPDFTKLLIADTIAEAQ